MSKNLVKSSTDLHDYTGIAVVRKASHSGNISEEAMEGINEHNKNKQTQQAIIRHYKKKSSGLTRRNKYTGTRATKRVTADFFNDPSNELDNVKEF